MTVPHETFAEHAGACKVFCRCGREARPNQRTCLPCHAASSKIYRAVRKARDERHRIARASQTSETFKRLASRNQQPDEGTTA